ncbi:hypothetical protein GCM10009543_02680 [Leifsonia naganoensis]
MKARQRHPGLGDDAARGGGGNAVPGDHTEGSLNEGGTTSGGRDARHRSLLGMPRATVREKVGRLTQMSVCPKSGPVV